MKVGCNEGRERRSAAVCLRASIGAVLMAAAAAQFGAIPEARAQQPRATEAQLEEITVTARRREESLLEVPIAVTAVSAERLAAYNFRDLGDLQLITPGFQVVESGFRRSRETFNLVVRGLNVGTSVGLQNAASIFIDGAPFVGGRPASFADIERVEVLKGPQTAYFGRATFAGAINFVTKNPSLQEWGGEVTGEIGQYGTSDAIVSVNGPVIDDKLGVRLTARNLTKGAQYTENMQNMEVGERNTESGSLTVLYTPTDALRIKVFGEYAKLHDGLSMVFDFPVNEFGNCSPGGAATPQWICGVPPSVDIALSRVGFPAVLDGPFRDAMSQRSIYQRVLLGAGDHMIIRNTTAHAIADYQFGNGMTLSGIAAYHRTKAQWLEESTQDAKFGFFPCPRPNGCGRPFGQYLFLTDGLRYDRSLEARLTSDQEQRLRWIVGATYSNASSEVVSNGELPATPPSTFGLNALNTTETYGVFGGVNFDFTEKLTGGVELRYQSDEVFLNPNQRAATVRTIDDTFKSTTPRVSLQYQLTPDYMIYGSYAQGVRPGTFNGALLARPQFVIDILTQQFGVTLAVEEEELTMYELGLKGRWLDQRLQATVAVYKGEVTNQQISQSIFVNTPQFTGTVGFINNAGETDLQGVEIESSWLVTDRWRLDAGFSYADPEIVKDNCAQCVRIGGTLKSSEGKNIDGVPLVTGNLTVGYTIPLDADRNWYSRVEYFYTGKAYGDRLNLSETNATNIVNLRTGLTTGSFDIEAYLTNAFGSEEYLNIGLSTDLPSFGVSQKVGLPEKRLWGLRGTYRF